MTLTIRLGSGELALEPANDGVRDEKLSAEIVAVAETARFLSMSKQWVYKHAELGTVLEVTRVALRLGLGGALGALDSASCGPLLMTRPPKVHVIVGVSDLKRTYLR